MTNPEQRETGSSDEKDIAELRGIAERMKKLRERLPADSRGLGGAAFKLEQICGEMEATIRAKPHPTAWTRRA